MEIDISLDLPRADSAATDCPELRGLVVACQNGDAGAFDALFERFRDRVHSLAFNFTNDETAAKDVSQRVFLKLYTDIRQYRHGASFTTWLYRIVVNACMDEHRRRRRWLFFTDFPGIFSVSREDSMERTYLRKQVAEAVREAIGQLKPVYRIPVLLKYVDGMSYDEIAEVLGCSKGTVASRLNRGHLMLAKKLAHLRGALNL